jgi:transitional endoplasmic reticulum ATPase
MVALRRYLSLEGENHLGAILSTSDKLQITMEDFLTALREVEPTAIREFYTERSTVRWHHLGGLHEIKEALRTVVDWPIRFPHLFTEGKIAPPRGVLFTGPSGTGKTLMAKALAGETGLNFISISGPIIFSKWLGESEKALHNLFKKAKQSAPCILFFDEIDALIMARGAVTDSGAVERIESQFFNELDNLTDLSQVIVLGATNREDLLDPALTRAGRLDYVLRFPIPDEKDRLEMLQVHTRDKPLAQDVNLADLARLTEGMVGSQIASLCRNATMIAISEIIQKGERKPSSKLSIQTRHFKEAIQRLRSKEGDPRC